MDLNFLAEIRRILCLEIVGYALDESESGANNDIVPYSRATSWEEETLENEAW